MLFDLLLMPITFVAGAVFLYVVGKSLNGKDK